MVAPQIGCAVVLLHVVVLFFTLAAGLLRFYSGAATASTMFFSWDCRENGHILYKNEKLARESFCYARGICQNTVHFGLFCFLVELTVQEVVIDSTRGSNVDCKVEQIVTDSDRSM